MSSSINLKKSFAIALAMREMTKQELAEDMGVTKALLTNATSGSSSMSVAKLDEAAGKLGFKLWQFLKLGDDE